MLRAVLFDLDDALVDQENAAIQAVVPWAAEYGVLDPDVGTRWAEISGIHYARYQRRELTFAQQRRCRVRDFLKIDADDQTADNIFAGYLSRYEEAWTLFPDAIPALRRARAAGLTVAVFTNGEETHQRQKINTFHLGDEIDLLISSSALPAGKPDPRAFQHAVQLLDVSLQDALMVGNSLDTDVHGALNAGLSAVLLDRADAHATAGVPRVRALTDLTFT